MAKAVVFFAEGTEECEALLVVDLLRRAKVEVLVASASPFPIDASFDICRCSPQDPAKQQCCKNLQSPSPLPLCQKKGTHDIF